jgi:hypothetical protein
MQDSLERCERDVEAARAKLAQDLSVLRSPDTFAAFTDDLKQDATELQDEWVGRAKGALQEKTTGVIEDLKAKAAANPAAALMIGAGVGWFFLRHPPITSALVGCGLYSLLRTPASAQPHMETQDYLHQGQQRLKEQASTAASVVAEKATTLATDARDTLAAKSGELIENARHSASGVAHEIRERIEPVTAELHGEDVRDSALLGIAGMAVAAACVLAWQKRSPDNLGPGI